MDAVGLARGRSHAIPPWPDQEAHEAKCWVTNEALAIYFGKKCGTNVRTSFTSLRRATRAISQLLDSHEGSITTSRSVPTVPLGRLAPSSVRPALRYICV